MELTESLWSSSHPRSHGATAVWNVLSRHTAT